MAFNKRDIRTFSMLGCTRSFFSALTANAVKDSSIVIMTADLSRGIGLDKFRQSCPEQFFNVGIAEQNMIGIAAGMAKVGLNVFAISYPTFLTSRCFDQIRVNLGYMGFPVKLIARSRGLKENFLGATHYGVDDVALMRAVPNMIVAEPADALEAVKIAESSVNISQPMYIRLDFGTNIPIVYKEDYDFQIGKAEVLQEGTDIAIFAAGTMVNASLKAAKILAEENISVSVVNVHTIKPLDVQTIDKYSAGRKLIVSVEEHGIIGGLGSAIAEHNSEKVSSPPQLKIGIPDAYGKAGSYEYLLDKYGLTAEKICAAIKKKFLEL